MRASSTLNGFTAAKFQELCNNKGPTLTVVKSHLNKIFGGYTALSWDNISGTYK